MTREFTITRVFDAPRELVFKAWTDPGHATCWFGPHGLSTPLSTITMDVRPGGEWRVCMIREADGARYPAGGVYREVVEPERLVFTWWITEPVAEESLITIVFEDLDGKTRMVFHQIGADSGVHDGWTQSFEKFADYVREQA